MNVGMQNSISFASRILRLHEAGLLVYAFRRANPLNYPCAGDRKYRKKSAHSKTTRVISMKDFSGAFLVLAGGLCVSCLALIYEMISFTKLSLKQTCCCPCSAKKPKNVLSQIET